MTQIDQEWMERYIYQVVSRLPREQREEVGMELRELIGDMMENEGSIEEVLTQLGDPAEFARKYRDDSCYLIGPEYYDAYLWFMRLVLICTLISSVAASLLEGIRQDYTTMEGNYISAVVNLLASGFANGIANAIISCIGAFGGVTIIFAVMERQKVKLDWKNRKKWSVDSLGEKRWNPKELTAIPDKKAMISRSDSIVGVIFAVIFGILLIVSPEIFSVVFVWAEDEKELVSVSMLHLEQWDVILPLLIAGLFIGLADEVVKLVKGVYCRLVMYSNMISGAAQIVLGIILLKVLPFWNPDFVLQVRTELEQSGRLESAGGWWLNWNQTFMSNICLAFIIILTLAEIGVTVYRTLRYGVD